MSTLDPVTRTVDVPATPQAAFEAFTKSVTQWWPLDSHSLSRYECEAPAKACAFETHVGGEFYEIMADGTRKIWGSVLVWEPGKRLIYSWHVGRDPAEATEVDISFEAQGAEFCRVTLTHRNWERMGEVAPIMRDGYATGWVTVFDECFGGFFKPDGAGTASA